MNSLDHYINKPVRINAPIKVGDLLNELTEESALAIIHGVDLSFQDADFTMTAIKALFKSLCTDMDEDEMKSLIKELKVINKERRK
jgi:hypothetical protein